MKFYTLITLGFLGWGIVNAHASTPIQQFPLTETTKAWLVSDATVPMLAFQMTFPYGSVFDPTGKEGLAHLAASTLDEGAGDYDSTAFHKKLEELHASLRFTASNDNLTANLVCLKDTCPEAFQLLTLTLTKPRFDPEPVERMKQAILTSLAEDKTNPSVLAGNSLSRLLYKDHPYSRPSDGTEDGIHAITPDDLRAFLKNLSAQNLMISAAGDMTGDTLTMHLLPLLKALPLKPASDRPIAKASVEMKAQTQHIPLPLPQTTIVFGSVGLPRQDPDFMASYVMNHILGGSGFTSRLTQTIREKNGLTYGISTALDYGRYGETWGGGFATKSDKVKEAIALLKQDMQSLKDAPVTNAELQDAKQYLIGSYALHLDSNAKLVSWLTGLQRDGLPVDYAQKREVLINALTPEDIQRTAKRLLHPDQLTLVTVGKETP